MFHLISWPSYASRSDDVTTHTRTYTHQVREEGRDRPPDLPLAPHEDRVGLAHELLPGVLAEVAHRADHVVEAHEEGTPGYAKSHGAEERADKALNRLLGRKLDQGRLAEGDAADVGEDVVADDERRGNPEPDDTLQNVVDDEVAGRVLSKDGCFRDDATDLETTTRSKLMCTQQKRPNCCLS